MTNTIKAGMQGSFPAFSTSGAAATSVLENQPPVTLTTRHSFYFPGWHDLTQGPCPANPSTVCDTVPASASLATIPDYDIHAMPGVNNKLSPRVAPTTGSATTPYWSVTVDIRADDITVETDPNSHWDDSLQVNPDGFGTASPNIIQQGKASAGGQWKLSQHPKAGSSTQFTVSCDFQDTANATRTVGMARGAVLTTLTDYHLTWALLRGGFPQLTISKAVRVLETDTNMTYPPTAYTVSPSDDVFFGKKSTQTNPGGASNTHANDAYAGRIDTIQIMTSHS